LAVVAALVTLLIGTGAVVAAAHEQNGARTLSAEGTGASRGQETVQLPATNSQQPGADDEDCAASNSQTSSDCEDVDETGPDEAGDNNQKDDNEPSGQNP